MRYFLLIATAFALHAETGADAWLRYAALDEAAARPYRAALPAAIVSFGSSPAIRSAQGELVRGIRGMLGRTLRIQTALPGEPALVHRHAGRPQAVRAAVEARGDLPPDGYWLTTATLGGVTHMVIAASNDRGVLYGAFALLRKIALGEPIAKLNEKQSPYAPRALGQRVEQPGRHDRARLRRAVHLLGQRCRRAKICRASANTARLLASLGINACSINNVNANPRVLAPDFLPQIARIAEAFRPWGVRVAIAVDFGSPQDARRARHLRSARPQGGRVVEGADRRDLRAPCRISPGIVLKADSEGRVGPVDLRSHPRRRRQRDGARAQAARRAALLPRLRLRPPHADWRDPKNDRARAAYDNFQPLDGKFDDNVIVQIKHGPIDFQVREPASPLFGALEKTNQAIELQITQEYFGQGRHTVFLVPMWKATLDFDMHAADGPTPVKALVAGKVFKRPMGGFVGVSNVGLDDNWYGNHLSQANLYGFGRLAWNPDLSAQRISDEWTRQTFGSDPEGRRHRQSHAAHLLAHVRKLHRPAGTADAHRYRRRSLRRRGGGVGAQRLGPVASCRRARASGWTAPSPRAPGTSGSTVRR